MEYTSNISTVVAINNAISAELTRQDLVARNIPIGSVMLILLRNVYQPWMAQCAMVVPYPGRPATGLIGQWRFLGFYHTVSRILRPLSGDAPLDYLYVVNNDNLITSHLLAIAEGRPGVSVTVVVEGIMNFQEIGIANRARWRWWVKPPAAKLLGFRYRQPRGHLSGAFESRVDRVVSFMAEGLKGPADKVVIRRFQAVQVRRQSDPKVALVVLSGLDLWMDPTVLANFSREFVSWIERSGFCKVQVKKHPRVSGGLIEQLLEGYEEKGDGLTVEEMAADLEAGVIIGACSTALVTLKLIRPDLQCIDFGSDFYIKHAFQGDDSVKTLFRAAGVTIVPMVPPLPEPLNK